MFVVPGTVENRCLHLCMTQVTFGVHDGMSIVSVTFWFSNCIDCIASTWIVLHGVCSLVDCFSFYVNSPKWQSARIKSWHQLSLALTAFLQLTNRGVNCKPGCSHYLYFVSVHSCYFLRIIHSNCADLHSQLVNHKTYLQHPNICSSRALQ